MRKRSYSAGWNLALVVAALALAGLAGGRASAAGSFRQCGSFAADLVFHLEVQNVTCAVGKPLTHVEPVKGSVRVVKAHHVFSYRTKSGWSCIYEVIKDVHAQDQEGEIFNCRQGADLAWWSESDDLQPVKVV